MMPLRTRLKNGDIVEIVTNAEAQAEPRLAELRRHVAGAQQDQALPPGRGEGRARSSSGAKLLEKEARRFDLNVKALLEETTARRRRAGVGRAERRRPAGGRSATAASARARC